MYLNISARQILLCIGIFIKIHIYLVEFKYLTKKQIDIFYTSRIHNEICTQHGTLYAYY